MDYVHSYLHQRTLIPMMKTILFIFISLSSNKIMAQIIAPSRYVNVQMDLFLDEPFMFQSSTKLSSCAHDPIYILLLIQDTTQIIVFFCLLYTLYHFSPLYKIICVGNKYVILLTFKKSTPHCTCPPGITLFVPFYNKSLRNNCPPV